MEAETKGLITEKNLKDDIVVPELLLSYTYFLNDSHTCFMTIGYDVNDFKLKIVVYKNKICICLGIDDWIILYKNAETIDGFFNNKFLSNFYELPKSGTGIEFKLSIRKNIRQLIIANKKKILLDDAEWKKLYNWLPYLTSIATWYDMTSLEIQNYYQQYLQLCIQNKVFSLFPQHFFLTGSQNNCFYNNSRLFQELPIFCNLKLKNDIANYYDNCE